MSNFGKAFDTTSGQQYMQAVDAGLRLDAASYVSRHGQNNQPPYFYITVGDLQVPQLSCPVPTLNFIFTKLGRLAEHGIIAHVEKDDYIAFKSRAGKIPAQALMRRLTAHNGKLGFNWDTQRAVYVVVPNEQRQYSESKYTTFLQKAAEYWSSTNAPLSAYYQSRISKFTKVVDNQRNVNNEAIPTLDQIKAKGNFPLARYFPQESQPHHSVSGSDKHVISTQQHQIKGLQDELQRFQKERSQLAEQQRNSIMLDVAQLNRVIDDTREKYDQGVDQILSDCERKYVQSMVDPFNASVPGVRVPTLNPVDTYTHTQFQTFSIQTTGFASLGKVAIVANFTAIRPDPVVIISDPQGILDPFTNAAPLIKNVQQYDSFSINQAPRTLGIWGTKTPVNTTILNYMNAPVNPVFSTIDQRYAGKIRLVAAGMRVFKTSQAISEAGTIKIGYKPRGGAPQTSLDRAIETGPTSRYNIKVFPSQATDLESRAGFLFQVNYRPHSLEDTDRLHSTTQDFASNEFPGIQYYNQPFPEVNAANIGPDGLDAESANKRFIGPLSIFAKVDDVDPWDYVNDLPAFSAAATYKGVNAQYALNAEDLGRPHTVVVTFEANQGISYEVELVQHWEIVPGEESPLEVSSCALSMQYSNALDLLRRYHVEQLTSSPFAPSNFSTTTNVWSLDPVYSAQLKALTDLVKSAHGPQPERVKGLFGDALRYLLRNLGVPAVDWLAKQAHTLIDKHAAKGLPYAPSDDLGSEDEPDKVSYTSLD